MITIGIPDLISPSYFPIVAAVDLGFLEKEGVEAQIALISPVDKTLEALRDGEIDFVGGTAHSVPHAFPKWDGAKIVAALSQNTYWFLVLRADLAHTQGDLSALTGLTIGAAPLVEMSLRKILSDAGITDVTIAPVPGAFLGEDRNFGLAAAKALGAGLIDGFWANGMGAAVAIQSGAGFLALDARLGDGPAGSDKHTFAALITRSQLIDENPELIAATVRALKATHAALKADPSLALEVGRKRFPSNETALLEGLIEHDLPFYETEVSEEDVDSMVRFEIEMGLLDAPVDYSAVIATPPYSTGA